MGWFDDQIRAREKKDNEVYSEAYANIAGSVLGNRIISDYNENRTAKNSLDEILKYYHMPAPENDSSDLSLDKQLDETLRPLGIMYREVELRDKWYRDAVGPMLGRLKEDGYIIALIPYGYNGYSYNDPRSGKRIVINSSNSDKIAVDAYAFYKPLPLRSINAKDLVAYMMKSLSAMDVALVILSSLIATLVGMLLPMIVHALLSNVTENKSLVVLASVGTFYACITIGKVLLDTINTLFVSRISLKINNDVTTATMMRILSLPPAFFRTYSAGELSEYQTQIEQLCSMIFSAIFSTGLTSLMSLIYVFQVIMYAPSLFLPALIITLVTLAVTVLAAFKQMKITEQTLKNATKESSVSYELISGIQKIKLAGAEKRAFSKWGEVYAKAAATMYNPPLFNKVSSAIIASVGLIGTFVMYFIAIKDGIKPVDFYAFNTAYGYVSAAFLALAQIGVTFAQIKPVYKLVKPILDAVPEVSEGRATVRKINGNVELDHVTFRYSEDTPVIIDDMSIKIRSGQYVAIVGKTGCGKSTLVRLLLGFEKPDKGAVYYDGKNLNTLDLKSLRKNIGVVIQDGMLFQGDILSNITITDPLLTIDDAWEAAAAAGIAEDIENMPMGMYTYISEGDGGVSGGQRQRLMIARAIAPKPKLLIFDEATSALDNITQKKVSESLDKLNCTRIVIAHRLSTIKNCDRIIVMDSGHIIEDGTYNELIEKNGFFAELVKRQRINNN